MIDLGPPYRTIVERILAAHVPVCEVRAFGSRATWTAKDYSDLDLAIVGEGPLPWRTLRRLKEAFEESDLPMRVDVLDWHAISDRFRAVIERDYVVVQERPTRASGDEWREVTLGECTVINDSTYSPKEEWPFINYLDTSSISQNHVSKIQHLELGRHKVPSRARRKVHPGDIVYSTVRPNQKHFGLLKSIPENFLASTGFAVLRGRDELADTEFIYWFLTQDHIVEYLHSIGENSTSAYPSIRPSDIEQLTLSLPPLSEQRVIAHILGTLDDKIELNRRKNQTLEAMARALFKSWFVNFEPVRAKLEGRWRPGESLPGLPAEHYDLFPDRLVDSELGETPEGWGVKDLGELANLNPESWSRTNEPADVEYVDLTNTKWGVIETTERFLWVDAPSRAKRILRTGDTIVGTVRPGNGSYSFIGTDGLTGSTAFAVLRPIHFRYRELVYLAATAPSNIDRLAQRADGAAYPAVQPEVVRGTEAVIPIADSDLLPYFSRVVGSILDSIESTKAESLSLVAQRDALLPRLVSGKIRV